MHESQRLVRLGKRGARGRGGTKPRPASACLKEDELSGTVCVTSDVVVVVVVVFVVVVVVDRFVEKGCARDYQEIHDCCLWTVFPLTVCGHGH